MINDLKAQLARCESWLLEEPNDREVIEKATQLRARIESLEKSDTKVEIKKDDNLVKEIKRIKRKIRNVKKKLLIQPGDIFLQNELEEMKTRVELLKNRKGVK